MQKVNRKAAKAALRSALASHAGEGTLAIVSAASFDEPSTKAAKGLVEGSGLATPLVVVAQPEEQALIRSFRNLERVAIVSPAELEVAAVVWARSLLVTESALPTLTGGLFRAPPARLAPVSSLQRSAPVRPRPPVASGYERSLRPSAAGVSRLPRTIRTGGDH